MSLTLTQALAAKGYTHRKPANVNLSGRDIIDESGVTIGRLAADEGWLWLDLGCPLNADGRIDTEALADAAIEREIVAREGGEA
jgi:hypothetical protein